MTIERLSTEAQNYLSNLVTRAGERTGKRIHALLQVLDRFTPENLRVTINSFVETAKLIGVRQSRLKKRLLKAKEVRSITQLIAFHYAKTKQADAKLDGLDVFLGKQASEEKALEYYEKRVVGKVKDRLGRDIEIPLDGMRHLFKDPDSGKHVMTSENFLPFRAKRLPWIRWTLENTVEIYRARSGSWIKFAYIQPFTLPLTTHSTGTNYFIVIVRRKDKQASLEFVTAFYFDSHEDFLKHVEAFEPFEGHAPQLNLFEK